MNDQLIMNNYLLVLKSTVEVFIHGTLESSNASVRDILKSGLDDILSSQACTYSKMVEYQYYSICNVDNNEIIKVLNNVTSKN